VHLRIECLAHDCASRQTRTAQWGRSALRLQVGNLSHADSDLK
jgi:hypothetical protein